MIVMQGVDGQNFGVAENNTSPATSDFVEAVNYACGKTICYAKGKANDAILKGLQNAINRFAAQLGFTPIQVDGFIGAKTVSAAQQVVTNTLMATQPALLAFAASKEGLTAAAPYMTQQFLSAAQAQNLGPVAPPPAPAKAPKTSVEKQEEAVAKQSAGGEAKGYGWLWWVLGGLALAGVGTIGYMTYKRRKEGGDAFAPATAGYGRY
jgi:lysozyme family protein